MEGSWSEENTNLFYLLRLLRISKVFVLMDLQQFTTVIRNYYRRKLIRNLARCAASSHEVDNNKIMTQIFIIKFFQVFRLIVIILVLSYLLGTIWFIITMHSTTSPD